MDIVELPTLAGDRTFQKVCKVVRNHDAFGVPTVEFISEDGYDVLWHDSRVQRYLQQNWDIMHYQAGAQWLDDVSYEESVQLQQSRQMAIDLCTSPKYKHIRALNWSPWEYHGSDAISFVLYNACSQQSNIDMVSTGYMSQVHNYE